MIEFTLPIWLILIFGVCACIGALVLSVIIVVIYLAIFDKGLYNAYDQKTKDNFPALR